MVTIRDVAAHAEVSTATVSRVLNDDHHVRAHTAQRVRDAVLELKYVPNSVGRSLRRQRSALWALIIADIENPFLTGVTRGVEDVAQTNGYSVLLCNSDEDADKERHYLDIAEQSRVTGVLITPTSPVIDLHPLHSRKVPVVALDRPVPGDPSVDAVLVDSRGAARMA
ncbi:LacI family DNA-binding transcriptional regulator, partial [Phytoactinopolyspora endophytica]|uniref:LacI family DNA-binding transcriptional regulator n=1 Tax=Phytoactinopolyspora endophytica TaxID=1642495 RepID=UPI003B835ADE